MRALIQRVAEARVEVDSVVIGKIRPGLLIFMCAMEGDTEETARDLALKIAKLRVFKDKDGKMNRSLLLAGGEALVISQFTLAADTSRGNRPGFSRAASPEIAKDLYEYFISFLASSGTWVESGQFGADMQVHLVNDGPVTIWMDTDT